MDHNSDNETTSAMAAATAVNRRPMNAFLLFCKRHRTIVKERYPNLENRNITKILGEWWQSLCDDDKSTFTKLASEYKEYVVRETPSVTSAAATGPKLSSTVEHTTRLHLMNGSGGISSNIRSASSSPEPPPTQRTPHHRHTTEAAPPPAATDEAAKNSVANSAFSSPTPYRPSCSGSSLASSSAPKPFKKRYLANFDSASLGAAAAEAGAAAVGAATTTVSPEAEHACKALLQLAGVRESSPTMHSAPNSAATSPPRPSTAAAAAATAVARAAPSPAHGCISGDPPKVDAAIPEEGNNSRNGSSLSRSGTASPPDSSSSAAEKERGKLTANGFRTLRDAVWSRVAKTLLKQEEEKGMLNHAEAGNDDAPLNLSSQCTIRGQTIIEHIIENCMQAKPSPTVAPASASGGISGAAGGDEKDARSASSGNAFLVNMNNNGVSGGGGGGDRPSAQPVETASSVSGSTFSAEEIKERIYEGLKQDLLSKRSGEKRDSKEAAALWNMLPHIKIAQERAEGKMVAAEPPADPKSAVTESEGSNLTIKTAEDGSKLSIKHLLAQSPAPLSPRSRSGNSSSKSSATVSPNANAHAAAAASAASEVSVTLVSNDYCAAGHAGHGQQPVNLSTTPPQTPSTTNVVTISATTSKRSVSCGGGESSAAQQGSAMKRKLGVVIAGGGDSAAQTVEEEEDDLRRSSRSCKGKRYQEFKDEGRLGRSKSGAAAAAGSLSSDRSAATAATRKAHKSGDSSSAGAASTALPSADVLINRKDPNTHISIHNSNPPFDITAKLNAIPALSLDSYQQKLLKAKTGGALGTDDSSRNSRATTSHHHQVHLQPQPQARRRSGDNVESTPPKRKSRRTATAAAGAASARQATSAGVSSAPTVKKDAKDEQQLMTADVVVSS